MRRSPAHEAMLTFLALCLVGPALATEYASTDPPQPILDHQTTTSTITITSTRVITDLNVKLNIRHAYTGDLVITLTGPGGAPECVLIDRKWEPVSVTFDDEGGWKPETPLSVFDGMSLAGTWTLRVTDESTSDEGTLNGWSLLVTQAAPDRTPPVVTIDSVAPTVLWPLTNRLVPVILCGSATDASGQVARVWCEVDDSNGELDGTHELTLDAQGEFYKQLLLRAARSRTKCADRIYELSVYAADTSGNVSAPACWTVIVPRNQPRR
ncbi:MAG: proprotein convertase P-domain-containing protein [Armatimonadia bacterium]